MRERLLSAILVAIISAAAHATDYSDIWWNPSESGWGINLAQSDKFIFATFFVYGPGNVPTWYAGTLTLDATGSFSGPLFTTTGTYLGTVPFNPAQSTATQVGNASFKPTAADKGTLTYNVGATVVAKNIQRQTLTTIPLAGSYYGGFSVDDSACSTPGDNGHVDIPANITVTQSPSGQLQLAFDFLGIASCTLSSNGPITQLGQLFSFAAGYLCSDGGPQASAAIYELRATSLGIEGRLTSPNHFACHEEVKFSGSLQ